MKIQVIIDQIILKIRSRQTLANIGVKSHKSISLNFIPPGAADYLDNHSGSIDGWLSLVAQWMFCSIADTQKKNGILGDAVEIGVWDGKTLLLIQQLMSDSEEVHGFDIELRPTLKENIKRLGVKQESKIRLTEIDSRTLEVEVLRSMHPNGIRIFHVDGYHTYENARNDLLLAFASANPAGVIALDDFFSDTVPAVTHAYFELAQQGATNGFLPFAIGGGKLFLCTENQISIYRDSLMEQMPISPRNGRDVDVLFGNQLAIYER